MSIPTVDTVLNPWISSLPGKGKMHRCTLALTGSWSSKSRSTCHESIPQNRSSWWCMSKVCRLDHSSSRHIAIHVKFNTKKTSKIAGVPSIPSHASFWWHWHWVANINILSSYISKKRCSPMMNRLLVSSTPWVCDSPVLLPFLDSLYIEFPYPILPI